MWFQSFKHFHWLVTDEWTDRRADGWTHNVIIVQTKESFIFFSRDQREGGFSADISSLACYGLLLSSADKL